VVCLFALTLALAAPAISRDTTGTIDGLVVGLDQKPVAASRVSIQESGNGEHPHVTLTDSSGKFSFQRFSPGAYDLRAYYLGIWSPWEKNVRLQAGKTTTVTLKLPASPSKDAPVKSGQ
jgi:Carboxypeptidase regulatory-like domain